MLPAIGSKEFRQLDFKEQLEIVSLQLFHEEEYERAVGIPPRPLVEIVLDYPPNVTDKPEYVDLPVSFVDHHWAAYSCAFKPKWYIVDEVDGCTPLAEFDVDYRKIVNVFAFNFDLISMDRSLYHLFAWIVRQQRGVATVDALVAACRIYLWLDLELRKPEYSVAFNKWTTQKVNGFKPNPRIIYEEAQRRFVDLYDYDDINGYCPTIEICDALMYWEFEDYVVHPTARSKNHRWFFPLIPARLYNVRQFRIWNWDWLK